MSVVLIVDDDQDFVTLCRVLLSRAGFDILTAYNAESALRLIYEQPPDLILLDDMMPGMKGSEMCVLLKADPTWQHIPIIMHTANQLYRDPDYAAQVPSDALLLKPALPPEIIATVKQVLNTVQV